MTLAYYPGCSLHGTSREYDESLRAVAGALGIDLHEVEDWSCCGATSAHATNYLLGVALPARNLALAEAQGHDAVLAPCVACFNRLATARHAVANDASLAARLPAIIERPFTNQVAVKNVLELLLDYAGPLEERAAALSNAPKPLASLKVAAYYGCLLVRPPEVTGFDDCEAPTSMERIIEACGAVPVRWNMATECCGGAFSLSRTASVVRLGRAIIADARRAGADAIVVVCPMCHSNLDFRQAAEGGGLPVLFVTQLAGLALGLPPDSLGLSRHFIAAGPLLSRLNAEARRAAGEAARGKGTGEPKTAAAAPAGKTAAGAPTGKAAV
jgi:heterodisulfide reductase subunit B